jgi:hypothetical protein
MEMIFSICVGYHGKSNDITRRNNGVNHARYENSEFNFFPLIGRVIPAPHARGKK